MKKLLFITLLATNCVAPNPNTNLEPVQESKYKIEGEEIGRGVWRGENNEVICYAVYKGGLQCKWK